MSFLESLMYSRPAPVPKMPVGLVELMEGLTKDVLKNNPADVYEYCANHMQRLLEIRDGPSNKKTLSLEQKIKKAQDKVRRRSDLRWLRYKTDLQEKAETGELTIEIPKITNPPENIKILKPVYHDHDLSNASEIEISCEPSSVKATFDKKECVPIQEDADKKSEMCEVLQTKDTMIKIEIEEGGQNDNTHENIDAQSTSTAEPLFETTKDNESLIENFDDDQVKGLLKNDAHDKEFEAVEINSFVVIESKTSEEILKDIDTNLTELNANDEANDINLKNENLSNINNMISGETSIRTDCENATVSLETTDKTDADKEIEKNESNEKEILTLTEVSENHSNDIIDSDFISENVNTNEMNSNGLIVNETLHKIKQNNNNKVRENENYVEENSINLFNKIEIKIDSVSLDSDEGSKPTEHMPEVASESEINLKVPNVALDVTEFIIHDTKHMDIETDEKASAHITTTDIEYVDIRKLVDDDIKDSTLNNSGNVVSESIDVTGALETTNIELVLTPSDKIQSDVLHTSNEYTPDMTNTDESNKNKIELSQQVTDIESKTISVHNELLVENATELTEGRSTKLIETAYDMKNIEVTNKAENEDETSIEQNDVNNQHGDVLETSHNDIDTSVNLARSSGDDSLTEESNSTIEGFVTDHSDDTVLNDSGNTMDLETAAVTIQKVFRNFLFKSRASTFEDSATDDHNLSYEDNDDDKKDTESFIPTTINKERRPLGISRMDTVLQTVNEEKSLSLSTDDSSTLSSAATIIQAHVRGFLVRNKLNSGVTASSNNSLLNSDGPSTTSLEDTDKNKNKTILNIHIVPEGGNYLSRDESMITSMDLSLDGSPPSSINLHPSYDKTNERRKQLKREDAVQSISPPSNNSGKLSEDVESVKDLPLHVKVETDANASLEQDTATVTLLKDTSQDTEIESIETTPTNSITVETVVEEHTANTAEIFSSPEPIESSDLKKLGLTKQSSDEMDVITPFKENYAVKESDTVPMLLHSGEFHDTVLPTKVSRNDTPVVSGE